MTSQQALLRPLEGPFEIQGQTVKFQWNTVTDSDAAGQLPGSSEHVQNVIKKKTSREPQHQARVPKQATPSSTAFPANHMLASKQEDQWPDVPWNGIRSGRFHSKTQSRKQSSFPTSLLSETLFPSLFAWLYDTVLKEDPQTVFWEAGKSFNSQC